MRTMFCEKKIKELQFEINSKTEIYDKSLIEIEERKSDLLAKAGVH